MIEIRCPTPVVRITTPENKRVRMSITTNQAPYISNAIHELVQLLPVVTIPETTPLD
jgi:hypothetical protein